ncbi:hypothetical protein BJY52DRAFT_1220490 [Lactarius psammicola]|nr:hypothetical protein BJY52DRAFT_1220490 [Lactarius psammicola]
MAKPPNLELERLSHGSIRQDQARSGRRPGPYMREKDGMETRGSRRESISYDRRAMPPRGQESEDGVGVDGGMATATAARRCWAAHAMGVQDGGGLRMGRMGRGRRGGEGAEVVGKAARGQEGESKGVKKGRGSKGEGGVWAGKCTRLGQKGERRVAVLHVRGPVGHGGSGSCDRARGGVKRSLLTLWSKRKGKARHDSCETAGRERGEAGAGGGGGGEAKKGWAHRVDSGQMVGRRVRVRVTVSLTHATVGRARETREEHWQGEQTATRR